MKIGRRCIVIFSQSQSFSYSSSQHELSERPGAMPGGPSLAWDDPQRAYVAVPSYERPQELREKTLALKLKGSIGEGPNHSNFSDQSSVKIQELLLKNLKKSRNVEYSTLSAKIRQNFIKI